MRIINECRLDFQYRVSLKGVIITNTIYSNKTFTEVLCKRLKIKKYVDKHKASIFEILTYTIVISNVSDFDIDGVWFKDSIPKETAFINNTVCINGTKKRCLNPNKGFEIGIIKKHEEVYISFKVVILQTCCDKITNFSNSIYNYIYNTEELPIKVKVKSNKVNTFIKKDLFKQSNITNEIFIKCRLPKIEKIKKIKIKVSTLKTKVVLYPVFYDKKCEKKLLYKIIIIGKIEYYIDYKYNALINKCNPLNLKNKKIKIVRGFSDYLLVPEGVVYLKKRHVKYCIENVSYKIMNNGSLFISIDMLTKL